ncbi:MAG: antitoxin, RHH family protein [Nitrospinae bacterium RIFCSPLOWO2_12_FULL_45_22]|nr:MAG: antitoxin, RHH family protein [Nitrospinae bacterium RIFCSPLOWO2_12_FULL_45_22]
MPAKNPRINLVLEKSLYDYIKYLAKKEGVSLSLKARDLLKDALEAREDMALAKIAGDREKTFDKSKALTHSQVW